MKSNACFDSDIGKLKAARRGRLTRVGNADELDKGHT